MSDIAQLVREKALAAHQATVQMGILRTAQKNKAHAGIHAGSFAPDDTAH